MKRMVCVLLALLLTGCAAKTAESSSALTAQQRELYGTVSAMVGNEMAIALGSYTASDIGMDAAALPEEAASGPQGEINGGTAGAERGEKTDGAPLSLPEGEAAPGEMGEAVTMQQGNRTGGSATGGFVPSGEEVTYQLPVDLPVTVAGSEATTSFRRIAAENLVRLVLEETAQGEQVVRIEILR